MQAPLTRRLLSSASLATLAGCISFADRTAYRTGCPASQVQLGEVQWTGQRATWNAACGDSRYVCMEEHGQTSCAPSTSDVTVSRMPDAPARWAMRTSVPAIGAALDIVAAHWNPQAPAEFSAELREPLGTFAVAQQTGNVKWNEPHTLPPALAKCADVRILASGEPVPVVLTGYELLAHEELLRLKFDEAALQRMAAASHVAGLLCGRRWELTSLGQRTIADFLVRVREEQLLGAPAGTAETAKKN